MIIAMLLFVSSFFTVALADGLPEQVGLILDTVSFESAFSSIITEHEWKELQLDRLVKKLDRTKTSLGQWGLIKLLEPISDQNEIIDRQKVVKFLVDNPKILKELQHRLGLMHSYERSFFVYWDKDDEVSSACDQFYYQMIFLKKFCNNSSVALDVGFATQLFDTFRGLMARLCLLGLSREINAWMFEKGRDLNLLNGIKEGLAEPIKMHSLGLHVFKNRPNDIYSYKDYILSFRGSLGDRYHIVSKGMIINLKKLGLSDVDQDMNFLGLCDVDRGMNFRGAMGLFQKGSTGLISLIPTLFYDYIWGNALFSIGRQILGMYQSVNQLQNRLVDCGRFSRAMMDVRSIAKKYSFIADSCCFDKKMSNQLDSLMKDLTLPAFNEKCSYMYFRGKVLCVNKRLQDNKKSMLPLMQSIGLLDAYCSIAQLYIEHQESENSFSFVEFIDNDTPSFAYEGLWLGLLPGDKVIHNDFSMGGLYQGNAIFTGPNGGGKSTILKACGIAVVLAQSWAIVPSKKAQQTIFKGLRTGIATHEDLSRGLSTFMAEKKTMEGLSSFMQQSNADNYQLILIDEPYKGTVDEESAKRIYNFGKNCAQYPYALVSIATHVQKPIVLAIEMPSLFANYHVEIVEQAHGVFKRLFKVKQGPAMWWFEDEIKRGRFVDWISTEINA